MKVYIRHCSDGSSEWKFKMFIIRASYNPAHQLPGFLPEISKSPMKELNTINLSSTN